MAYPPFFSGANTDEQTWDFRQFYVSWLSSYFVRYSDAEKQRKYPEMLDLLFKIHSRIWGRVKKEYGGIDEEFNNIITKIKDIANKDKYTYLGKKMDDKTIWELSEAFDAAIEHLIWLKARNELYGKRRNIRGL